MSYQLGAELLNFGAFLAFIGVNASSFRHYWWKGRDRGWSQALIPICGVAVCSTFGSACGLKRKSPDLFGSQSAVCISEFV